MVDLSAKKCQSMFILSFISVVTQPKSVSVDALATLNSADKAAYNNETYTLDLSSLEIMLIDAIHSNM